MYDKTVGSNSFSKPGWLIRIDETQLIENCEIFEIESDVNSLVEQEATVSVEDESNFDRK